VAALEQVCHVARFPDLAVGALRVKVNRVLALQHDVSWSAVADELQIE
jgi:hypothetical protein